MKRYQYSRVGANESLLGDGDTESFSDHQFRQTLEIDQNLPLHLQFVLQERELQYHACRIYMEGCNTPSILKRQDWKMNPQAPIELAKVMNKDEFHEFAIRINKCVEWNSYLENSIYSIFEFLVPIIGSIFLYWRRSVRKIAILNIVSKYNFCRSKLLFIFFF